MKSAACAGVMSLINSAARILVSDETRSRWARRLDLLERIGSMFRIQLAEQRNTLVVVEFF